MFEILKLILRDTTTIWTIDLQNLKRLRQVIIKKL